MSGTRPAGGQAPQMRSSVLRGSASEGTDADIHVAIGDDDVSLQHAASGLWMRVVRAPSCQEVRDDFGALDARQDRPPAPATAESADLGAVFQQTVGPALHLRAARLFPALRWRLSEEEGAAAVVRLSLHRMDPYTWELDCPWCEQHLPAGQGWAGATPGAFLDHP